MDRNRESNKFLLSAKSVRILSKYCAPEHDDHGPSPRVQRSVNCPLCRSSSTLSVMANRVPRFVVLHCQWIAFSAWACTICANRFDHHEDRFLEEPTTQVENLNNCPSWDLQVKTETLAEWVCFRQARSANFKGSLNEPQTLNFKVWRLQFESSPNQFH